MEQTRSNLETDPPVSARNPFIDLERQWLQALRGFGLSGSEEHLLDIAWGCLGRALGFDSSGKKDLLRGYSFITISDLQLQQHVPCCSHLTWNSEEFRKWSHSSETFLPNQGTLQRTHLILIGYLTDGSPGEKEKLANGSLYVRDNTGMLPCLLLRFKLEWLDRLFLFPNWIYIPETGQSNAGYLEILQDPIQVVVSGFKKDFDISAFYPASAKQLLNDRPADNLAKMNVAGELSRLSPVLCFHQKSFFFLFLKCFSSSVCVPVLVQKMSQLVWYHALLVGHGYVITDLKISCLKASGFRVFITSSSSQLLPYCMEYVKEQFLGSASKRNPTVSDSSIVCVQLNSSLELKEETKMKAPAIKSKILSYKGTITRVLNAQAGLYELDNKVTLCLAYQQLLNSGRGLRPGAYIELQDVHLGQKLLPSSPAVLGACLRSRIVLKSFSVLSALHQPMDFFRNPYVQLLLHYNLSLPQYMWLVSIFEAFEQRFCGFIQQQPLPGSCHYMSKLVEMFIIPFLNNPMMRQNQERNIHEEILSDEHHCPLEQCQTLELPCQIPHFSCLHDMVEKKCFESPLQQLRTLPEIRNLNTQELNRRLAWSYCLLSAETFQPPVVLLGILEFSNTGFLQLKDKSRALLCVAVHKDGRPLADTSLIGCFVQIEIFQLVMEQFLQSDFPSWQQLEVQEYVKKKRTRLYVQFCFEDVKVLCAPEKCHRVKKNAASRGKGSTSRSEPSWSSDEEVGCVSRLFLVTQKTGLGFRNYLQTSEGKDEDDQASQLSFEVEGVWISKPELCRNPEESGQPQDVKMSALIVTSGVQQKLTLLFVKNSLQWFPFLHTDHLYQFIIPQCTDLEVFDKLCSSVAPGDHLNALSGSLFLPVPSAALFFHGNGVSQFASEESKMEQKLSSITEILSPSFSGSLVSFSGEIVERTLCESLAAKKALVVCSGLKKGKSVTWDYTVKLTISPAIASSAVLDVYIETSSLPYLWGMLPGARVLFQNLQRKVSRFGKVYCTYVACSCMSVLTTALCKPSSHDLGAASNRTTVYLSSLLLPSPPVCQARATCHVTCVLSLTLYWICSLCSSIFFQGRCNQNNPSCLSCSGVSKANACVLVEDGTSEFLVVCKNQHVQKLLGLSPKEWDLIENYAQRKGRIYIDHKETSSGPQRMEDADDLLTWYLRSLCRSPLVCRSILLTFKMDRKPPEIYESGQFRRFFSNEMEFLSKIVNRWNLICLDIQEIS